MLAYSAGKLISFSKIDQHADGQVTKLRRNSDDFNLDRAQKGTPDETSQVFETRSECPILPQFFSDAPKVRLLTKSLLGAKEYSRVQKNYMLLARHVLFNQRI